MSTSRERLIEWLRDAHAAEEQAHTMLTRTAEQVKRYPEFSAALKRHGEASQLQAVKLKSCLESLGEGISLIKTLTGQVSAFGQTISGYVVGDEPVKAALASSTFAHMEVASYRILVEAAKAAGEERVAEVCMNLLSEEQEFTDLLDQQLIVVTRGYVASELHA